MTIIMYPPLFVCVTVIQQRDHFTLNIVIYPLYFFVLQSYNMGRGLVVSLRVYCDPPSRQLLSPFPLPMPTAALSDTQYLLPPQSMTVYPQLPGRQ